MKTPLVQTNQSILIVTVTIGLPGDAYYRVVIDLSLSRSFRDGTEYACHAATTSETVTVDGVATNANRFVREEALVFTNLTRLTAHVSSLATNDIPAYSNFSATVFCHGGDAATVPEKDYRKLMKKLGLDGEQ